jgi:hypothetical protein
MSVPDYGRVPELPRRAVPPVHHTWVASTGDGRRFYRSAVAGSGGLRRFGIFWAIALACAVFTSVVHPATAIAWLGGAVFGGALFVLLLVSRIRLGDKAIPPGSVWASGFGANELLIITPTSTLVVDYAALLPPRVRGSVVLIRTREGAGSVPLSLELFPPAALTFLQQRTSGRTRSDGAPPSH